MKLNVTKFVNEVFSSNMYMLTYGDYPYCWLIDIGDFSKVASVLPAGMGIKGLLLTHTHFDHIYGINELYRFFPSCSIYTSGYGREALYDSRKNLSFFSETPVVFEGDSIHILNEGDKITLFPGILAITYATPGHCPSELTFSVDNYLFTGDAYIPDVKVYTKLPGGNSLLAKQTERRIHNMLKGRIVLAGHGDNSTL